MTDDVGNFRSEYSPRTSAARLPSWLFAVVKLLGALLCVLVGCSGNARDSGVDGSGAAAGAPSGGGNDVDGVDAGGAAAGELSGGNGDVGGSTTTTSCDPPDVMCEGACTDTTTDASHCGACRTACNVGESCTSGTCTETVQVIGGVCPVHALAVDADYVYWLAEWEVKRIATDGSSEPETLTTLHPCTALTAPDPLGGGGLALDEENVYFTDYGDCSTSGSGSVWKVPKTGGERKALTSGLGINGPQHLAIDATSVYWSDRSFGVTRSASINGGGSTDLASWSGDIALDGSFLYVVGDGSRAVAGSSEITKVPVSGGDAIQLVTGLSDPGGIALTDRRLFYSDRNVLYSVPTDGGSPTPLGPFGRAAGSDRYILSSTSEYIYWPEQVKNLIMRAPTAGGTAAVLTKTASQPGAVVANAKYVFWHATSDDDCDLMRLSQ